MIKFITQLFNKLMCFLTLHQWIVIYTDRLKNTKITSIISDKYRMCKHCKQCEKFAHFSHGDIFIEFWKNPEQMLNDLEKKDIYLKEIIKNEIQSL